MALTMGRRERGAVAVEMAIILPLLLLVVGGIVDFGRLLFTQNIVTNAAREGARSVVARLRRPNGHGQGQPGHARRAEWHVHRRVQAATASSTTPAPLPRSPPTSRRPPSR